VISLKQLLAAITRTKWVWIGLTAVLALRFYYVREMIAALMIFSVFVCGGSYRRACRFPCGPRQSPDRNLGRSGPRRGRALGY